MNGHQNLVENIAYACTRKQIEMGYSQNTAVRWVSNELDSQDYSYQNIEIESNRIGNVLLRLGMQAGDTVSIFLPRSMEIIYSFFAILKIQAISCILFSTFGESALFDRLDDSNTRIVITKKSLMHKVINLHESLPAIKMLVIDIDEHLNDWILSLPKLTASESDELPFSKMVSGDTPVFLQYTSGSTGKPKAALHVHGALKSMIDSFNEVFNIQENEWYWCTADPAWITGLVYGILAPLNTRTRQIQFGGVYKAAKWLSILQDEHIGVWYTAPTALRMLMQEDPDVFKKYDYSYLKKIFCVGEPLNPEIYYWGINTFGKEIYDTWFQSETGSIMIANRPGLKVKPGSMGKPLPGIEVYILDGQMKPVDTGSQGHLCLKKGWPSMFRSYWHKEALYKEKFFGDYYITGDLAKIDEDGYIWYISRADDVINTAGHLVGPFEVESVLLEVEEIVDVAVIGVPDAILHEKIVAFVCLAKNGAWSRELELKCRIKVANHVSSLAIPQEFHVVDTIPKNQSGKILRRVLKARYEGKDPGDLSTLEGK